MNRTTRVVAALVVMLLLALPLVGCGDQTAEANDAMSRANAAIDEYNATDAEVARILDEVQSTGDSAEGAGVSLELLGQVEAELANGTTALEAAKSEMAAILDMNVSDEYKTYVGQQVDIVVRYIELQGLGGELVAAMRAFYDELAKPEPNADTLDTLATEVQGATTAMDEVAAMIADAEAESAQYFEDSGLAGQ